MTTKMRRRANRSKQMQRAANSGEDEVVAPAVVTALHRRDRELSKCAGAPKAWSKMTVLEHAYQQERLGAKGGQDAYRRKIAGETYTEHWDCAQKAGRDSTAAFDVGRCMGSGLPLSEAQRAAIRALVGIEMHLGRNDRTILRAVLGMGHSLKEAMDLASVGDGVRVSARFCEALDALASAVEHWHKQIRRK